MRTSAMLMTILGLAIGALGTGNGLAGDAKKDKAPYVHAVIFYLKKDAPKDATETMLADCHKLLAKIPSVRGLWAGLPAEKSTPKFAVTDYQIGLLVLFDNFDGLQAYLDHPLHTEFVDKHLKHLEKVPVYDFINKTK